VTKKFSKEDLTRLAEKVREENRFVQEGAADNFQAQYLCEPPDRDPADPYANAIEKENQEGLRIGKYGNLLSPGEETPTLVAANAKVSSYTGFLFQEHPGLFSDSTPKKTTMVDWSWTAVPWYARLLGLLRLPYDVGKFIVTGRLIVIPWPWRW
jgi:hypothetical protein